MNVPSRSVNAWIYLNDDYPEGTIYTTPESCYQALITYGVYNSTDVVNICWVNTVPTSATTVPAGDGSTHTIQLESATHTDGTSSPTNQDYMDWLIQDARGVNPGIKLMVTLGYGANELTQIFADDSSQWQQNANDFAFNLLEYLKYYGLDGFDVDWEPALSDSGTTEQFNLLFTAIRTLFDTQDRYYYLTLSPNGTGILTNDCADTLNSAFDWVTLQLYGGACAESFTGIGVKQGLLMYGAMFEPSGGVPFQDAQQAYAGHQPYCSVPASTQVITNWRLNSNDYHYEQAQQMILYQLVYGIPGPSFDDSPIAGAAGNPLVSQVVVRSGEVLDAIQATSAGTFEDNPVQYVLMQHGGDGGGASTVTIAGGDALVEVSGYTGTWFGWNVVLQVTLTTRNGQVSGPFGSMANASSMTPFTLSAPQGQSIVAFSGSVVNVPLAGGGTTDVVQSLAATYA